MGSPALYLSGNVFEILHAELSVHAGRQLPAVRVEDCQQGSASIVLPNQVLDNDIPQCQQQLPGGLRIQVHPLLGLCEAADSTTLHHVAHESPRRSRETNDGDLVVHPVLRPVDRIKDVTQGLLDVGREVEPIHVNRRAQRKVELGPSLRNHLAGHSHGHRDDENVGKHYQRVKAGIAPVRLQRHLCDQRGIPAHSKEVVSLKDSPVLGQVPPGLPHHPLGGPVHLFSTGCPQQPVVGRWRAGLA
mmetsp:Transcript_92493/g.214931  ORF Transcript_92493/g.214931 Transcript_92493/m.214931 type:complete len:245 (-) Transcript_92493:358-1092(-)